MDCSGAWKNYMRKNYYASKTVLLRLSNAQRRALGKGARARKQSLARYVAYLIIRAAS